MMMNSTSELILSNTDPLDRAILAGQKALDDMAMRGEKMTEEEVERGIARAVIGSIWEHVSMARKPYSKTKGYDYNAGVVVGFEAALREFSKFIIVEGEG
jgi:hypothetical protein